MAIPRSEQVDLASTPYYHCMSRCVRRAFLCGDDRVTGRNFDHRRGWIRDRLKALTEVFAIDVCAYAVMSNHLHVVVHVNEARARTWNDDEVVQRYGSLYRLAKKAFDELASKKARAERVRLWRGRLSDISWMMRALNEFIARRANKEDGVRGHFWEGRFRSQPLLDESGLLTCMAYVDLNPVRAGLCKTLEGSDFTSIQDRLRKLTKDRQQRKRRAPPASLAGFQDPRLDVQPATHTTRASRATHTVRASRRAESGQGSTRVEDSAFCIPFELPAYVQLLQWTGRQLSKRGRLHVQPDVLTELGLDGDAWVDALRRQLVSKARYVGSESSIRLQTQRRGGRWSRGIGLARRLAA